MEEPTGKCELLDIPGYGKNDTCENMYNCCDCGGNECGCAYCFSCNACDTCKGLTDSQ